MEKQIRLTLPIQIRKVSENEQNKDMIVEGYAFKYNEETVLYERSDGYQYKEIIEKGALKGADIKDVPFKYNHNDSVMIVARTRNGSLKLQEDDIGLKIEARFIDTQTGKDLYKMIQEGVIDKMSFAFTEESDANNDVYGKNSMLHRITKFKRIWDVSAVDIPAYDATEIYARSIAQLENRAIHALEKASEDKRKRMMLKNKIDTLLED